MRRFLDSWGWLLGLYTAAAFMETVFWGQMGAFTPLYLPRLGIPPEAVPQWVGLVASVTSLAGLPFLPFWGALADRYARQPIIIRSFVVYVIAAVITIMAGNIWVFVVGRAAMSLSLGNTGLMMTTLSERAPEKRIGLAFAIMNSATPVGVFVGPLLGGPIVDRWGFPALMTIDIALLLLVIAGLTFGYRDHYRGTRRGSLVRMAFDSVGLIWRAQRLRALFMALFLLFAGWILAMTYVPVVVAQLYHGPRPGTAVGLVLGASGLVALVVGPSLGALGDRYGHWRVLIIGALAAVALWPLPALTRSLPAFAVLWALVNGLTSGLFAMSFSVLSFSCVPGIRGRVMAFSFLPANLGGFLGPAIGAVITRASVFAVFPAGAVLTLLGIGVLLVAQRQPMAAASAEAVSA